MEDGKNGSNGKDGQSCSVIETDYGSIVKCGTKEVVVKNGTNGTNGTSETNGTNG